MRNSTVSPRSAAGKKGKGPARSQPAHQQEPALSRAETADYVCEILAGLRSLTAKTDLPMLTYLIDMAYEEGALHRSDTPPAAGTVAGGGATGR